MREAGFSTLRTVASTVLAASARISLVAINHADATVLQKHFPGLAGWQPNPVRAGGTTARRARRVRPRLVQPTVRR